MTRPGSTQTDRTTVWVRDKGWHTLKSARDRQDHSPQNIMWLHSSDPPQRSDMQNSVTTQVNMVLNVHRNNNHKTKNNKNQTTKITTNSKQQQQTTTKQQQNKTKNTYWWRTKISYHIKQNPHLTIILNARS